jgi:hypothetical protein
MRKTRFFLGGLVAGLAIIAPACSTTATGATLVINSVTSPASVGSLSPSAGRYFVEVNVTLGNPGSAPIPAWFYYFQLITMQGIDVSPALDANAVVGTPCADDIFVGPQTGATPPNYRCNIVFEVPCNQTAQALDYAAGGGAGAEIPAPPAPPSCSSSTGDGGA